MMRRPLLRRTDVGVMTSSTHTQCVRCNPHRLTAISDLFSLASRSSLFLRRA